jgi:hypothetical protein
VIDLSSITTLFNDETVKRALFSGGFGCCFQQASNQFLDNFAPSDHSTPYAPLDLGTTHPLVVSSKQLARTLY